MRRRSVEYYGATIYISGRKKKGLKYVPGINLSPE
jgi:hypothetical protein